jgi:DnaJ domain
MSRKNYYQILGVKRSASSDEIKKAYKLYAAKFHPDKHDGDTFFEDRFKEVREAYDVLSDDDKRIGYDVRRFGKSVLTGRSFANDFEPEGNPTGGRWKFRLEARNLDYYVSLFYLINVSALVVLTGLPGRSLTEYIGDLFLVAVSTLFVWIAVNRWMGKRNGLDKNHLLPVVAYLLVALILGALALYFRSFLP